MDIPQKLGSTNHASPFRRVKDLQVNLMNTVPGYGTLGYMPAAVGSIPFYFAPFNGQQVICAKMVLAHLPKFWDHFLGEIDHEDVTIERADDGFRLVECTQRAIESADTLSIFTTELKVSAEFRYALLEMMKQFQVLGAIGYSVRWRNMKKEIQIRLVGRNREAVLDEPCKFARLLANKLSDALTDNPVGRIFNKVFDAAIEHLGFPDDDPKSRLSFVRGTQRRAFNEYTFGLWAEIPFLTFYYERQKFWFNCGNQRNGPRVARLEAVNRELLPLAEEYERLRWIIDGKAVTSGA